MGLHAVKANAIAERSLRTGSYSPFANYATIDREVTVAEGSRFDFRLTDHPEYAAPCWIEVKSVTLCEKRAARFPDAVTERGRRHLEHLTARHRAGDRAALVFIVQRADADSVAPADDIDPAYGAALRDSVAAGVEVHALGASVRTDRIILDRILPVLL